MSRHHIVDQLARHIGKTLSDGFELDPDTLHFLHSSYSIDQYEDLELFVNDGYEDELETILDLVISPDHRAMCAFESYFVKEDVSAEDEDRLFRELSQAGLKTRITFPDDTRYIEMDVPRDVIKRFVRKLNMAFGFPDRLQTIMADRLSDSTIIPARVLLRHSRWEWNDELIEFLSLFFTYASHDEHQMLDDLNWVIGVLSSNLSGKSIRDVLIQNYHEYRKRISELETVEEMLTKNTMETLMLQGVRIPSITAETLRYRIDTVRRILASVYAWVDVPGPSPAGIDLGDFTGRDGIKKILGLLS